MDYAMTKSRALRTILILLILILNISCDQISKMIVRERIQEDEYITVLMDHVTLTRVENAGAFLSLGSTLPYFVRTLLLSFIPLMAMTIGLYYLFQQRNLSRLMMVGYAFVIGGGLGNLYDRVINGSVTDFLHIDFVLFQTGIFNMADVSIMMGVGLLLLGVLTRKKALDQNQV